MRGLNGHGLLSELKRRNVFRAAAFYIAAVWALAQGIAQLGPPVGAPEWITRWFLVAAAVGFPFWVAFAWFYAFTPQGLKRESEIVEADAALRRASRRKRDFWITAILAVAVVLLATNTFVLRRDATSVADEADANAVAARLATVPAKSIAVLPLVNVGDNRDQAYFSDGLSEDLINALSQFAGLKVIGRNSSFQFRGTDNDPRAIAAKLGVAHLLEGSVRHAGETVRISVRLINAIDSSTLWSQRYDRPYKDLFALQDEIVGNVAGALQARLGSGADRKPHGYRPASGNLEAYTAFLQSIELSRAATNESGYLNAIAAADKATRLDPGYVQAHAGQAVMWVNVASFRAGESRQEAIANARAATRTAVELDPDDAAVHNAVGTLHQVIDHEWNAAQAEYRRAIELDAAYTAARVNLAGLLATTGRPDEAVDVLRGALTVEPLNPLPYGKLGAALTTLGRLDEAEQALRKLGELQPSMAPHMHAQLAKIEILRGNAGAALAEARQSPPDKGEREGNVALALQIGDDRAAADAALAALVAMPASGRMYWYIADAHALRKDADQAFLWLDRAVANDEGVESGLLVDPFLKPLWHDARFIALCRKLGLPVPGEASGTMAMTDPRTTDSTPANREGNSLQRL